MGKYRARVRNHLICPAQVGLTSGPVEFARRMGQPVPSPVAIRLLIDTGSNRTTIIPGILRHLDPPSGDPIHLETPLAGGTTRLFWVSLSFPEMGLAPFEHVQVALLAMPPGLAQFHGLLGRDLLQRWESFDYEGRRGRYTVRDAPGLFGWLRRWL